LIDRGAEFLYTVLSLRHFQLANGVLYPLARGHRRLGRGASRPARAAWLVQRLLTVDGDGAGEAWLRILLRLIRSLKTAPCEVLVDLVPHTARVAEHVRMNLEREASLDA
jgi:hypothetical protein